MLEFGKYSNDIYELKISTWDWKKISARKPKNADFPKPRLGHSFTMIGTKLYLFGGLANDSENPRDQMPSYLNDLYTIEIKNTSNQQWECPPTHGTPPSPRESHSASAFTTSNGYKKLLIYGGMNGQRLGDLFLLDISSMTWSQPTVNGLFFGLFFSLFSYVIFTYLIFFLFLLPGIPPAPRSLHSATVVNNKLYIFGGWIHSDTLNDSRTFFKCSNSLSIFNFDSLTWEHSSKEQFDPPSSTAVQPSARAGHVGAAIGERIFLWSGRDGFRKMHQTQFCYSDLWYLETELPKELEKPLQLKKASQSVLDLHWDAISNAESYLVQIMKVGDSNFSEIMSAPPPPPVNIAPVPVPSGPSFGSLTSTANQPYIPDPSIYAAAKKLCLPDAPSPIVPPMPVGISHPPVAIMSQQPMAIHSVAGQSIVSKPPLAQTITAAGVAGVPQPIASQMPTSTIAPIQSVALPGQQLAGMQALAAAAEQTGRLSTNSKIVHIQHAPGTQIQHPTPQTLPQTSQQTVSSTVRIITPHATNFVRPSNIMNVVTSHPGPTPMNIQASGIRLIQASLGGVGAKPVYVKAGTPVGNKMAGTIKTGPLIKVLKPNEMMHSSIITTDQAFINRQANVGKRIGTTSNLIKFVLPTSSASGQISTIQQTGKIRATGPQKTFQIPKNVSLRHLNQQAVRIVNPNGALGGQRLVLHVPTTNQAPPRPVVPIVATMPSTSDVDMMIDNHTAPPEEISTVIPQLDGAEDDSGDLDEKPQVSESNNVPSSENSNNVAPVNDNSGVKTDLTTVKVEPIASVATVPTPTVATPTTPLLPPPPPPSTPLSTSTPAPLEPLQPKNDVHHEMRPPSPPKRAPASCDGKWFDVGIFHFPKCNVSSYFIPSEDYDPNRMFDSNNLPLFEERFRYPLDSGTRYKIRIAGINQLGRGPFGGENSVDTSTPGIPSAPSQVRITKQDATAGNPGDKTSTGISLSWAASKHEEIIEYVVMLAVKGKITDGLSF